MLPIPAKTVFIDPEVHRRPNCKARLERMLPFIKCDDIREDFDETTLAKVKAAGRRRHGKDEFGDDAIIAFTTYGNPGWHFPYRDEAKHHGGACQPGLQINIVDGCPFRCSYCGFGRYIVFNLDVEQLVDSLDEQFAKHPDQRLFKYSNVTDLPPFEPEADLIRPMAERFAREEDRYLMLFTKSDNIDFMANVDHRGHTAISWSVSAETQSKLIDKRTATKTRRLNAMRKASDMGCPVRARLSPIVPVKNWREEHEALFTEMLDLVRPDVITLEMLGWMDVPDLPQIIDVDLIDPDMYQRAVDAADQLRGVRCGPFTEEDHIEVYRFCIETVQRLNPEVPICLCHGAPNVWKELGSLMKMNEENFLCNCGPFVAPGGALYDKWNKR